MVAEGRMSSVRVVEAFDEVENRIASVVVIAKARSIDQFTLEGGEEALAHGVIVAIADGAHRRSYARLVTAFAELNRGVLAALVGVMNDLCGRSLIDSHIQRRRD